MSFLKRLFGGGEKQQGGAPAVLGEESYKGYLIKAVHMQAGAEMQLAGTIEKEIGGELRSYSFVRADRISSREDLVSMALAKGRQIVDEQGDAIFKV